MVQTERKEMVVLPKNKEKKNVNILCKIIKLPLKKRGKEP